MSEEVTRPKPGPDPILDTDSIRKEFLSLVSMGLSQADAYEYVGLDQKTIYNYARSHPAFAAELRRALLKSKIHHLGIINAGSTGMRRAKRPDGTEVDVPFDGDWKASAWYLARRWPEEFAERQKHEVTATVMHKDALRDAMAKIDSDPEAMAVAELLVDKMLAEKRDDTDSSSGG